jgi:hypothetical protein
MIVDAGHSIYLTDADRRLVESHTGCMTRTHARSTLKFPDLMPNASLHPCYNYALLQIELGSFNRYPRLGK